MKVLMVMISHYKLGNTGRKTGFWLEEFAAPYFRFIDAASRLQSYRRRVVSLRWIRSAIRLKVRRNIRSASRVTRRLRPSWLIPFCFLRSAPKTMTQSSILVVMDRCGTLPRVRIPSPL